MFLQKLSVTLSQTQYGSDIIIIDPFDFTPNIESDIKIKLKLAESIKIECIRLLDESDIVVALVDDNDTGTAFEAGYAHAVDKPVILISQKDCSAANAMLLGAAKGVVNNILENEQIKKLAELILPFGTSNVFKKTGE